MESTIAALLREFENGRMTRRQFVQSLGAMVAVGAPAAALFGKQDPPTAAAGPAPWKTVWLDHISYAVSDYKRSTEFYTNLMGWEVKNDNGTSQATLDINGIGGIIIRNGRQRPATEPAAGAAGGAAAGAAGGAAGAGRGRGRGGRGGGTPLTGVINHISWGVEPWDTDGVREELERRGLNPRPDMVGEDFKSFHVRDPDGWDLQISNQTKDS